MMEIIVGTYEEFLVGYTLRKQDRNYSLVQSFTNHAHCGSIRSIASSNKHLASGSTDEVIYLINIKRRIETGSLNSHSGTITDLKFLRSYLFSSSEDGNICIWNTSNWNCEKILRGHKGPVTSIDVHSSGKLLISVSKDKTLRTWNLIKGRCAYIINLKDSAHQVLWSATCIYFALVFENRIDVYDLSTGAIRMTIDKTYFDKRINKILFVDDDNLIISGDCNELVIFDIQTNSVVQSFSAHDNRIKDMSWIQLDNVSKDLIDEDSISENHRWLITASSDQFIKIWQFDIANLTEKPTLIAGIDTTCRPTCLAVWTSKSNAQSSSDFSIPELKISKEELEVCKSKLKEKKVKRKEAEELAKESIKAQLETIQDSAVVKKMKPEPKSIPKKVEIPKSDPIADSGTPSVIDFDDDEDDVDAIRAMKMTTKSYKITKSKKNKRNITTFKQRMLQKRMKTKATDTGGEFRVRRTTGNNNRIANKKDRKDGKPKLMQPTGHKAKGLRNRKK